MQSSSVSSGKGFPVLSIAIAPTLASSISFFFVSEKSGNIRF